MGSAARYVIASIEMAPSVLLGISARTVARLVRSPLGRAASEIHKSRFRESDTS